MCVSLGGHLQRQPSIMLSLAYAWLMLSLAYAWLTLGLRLAYAKPGLRLVYAKLTLGGLLSAAFADVFLVAVRPVCNVRPALHRDAAKVHRGATNLDNSRQTPKNGCANFPAPCCAGHISCKFCKKGFANQTKVSIFAFRNCAWQNKTLGQMRPFAKKALNTSR